MQKKEQVLRMIDVLRKELDNTLSEAHLLSALITTPIPASETLKRWKARAVREISNQISQTEARNLEACGLDNFAYIYPFDILRRQIKMYDDFLEELAGAIERHPERVVAITSLNSTSKEKKLAAKASKENVIFIVHGHDEPNLYRLKELLKDRYSLTPIVLSSQSGSGRTIIEKFEEEAQKAAFAFVLLTPDDIIRKSDREYGQARPNVTFELGWFYGKLGRKKVCILFKKGTEIHSDLNGVSRIEFTETVNEKVEEIEGELVAGGLLKA